MRSPEKSGLLFCASVAHAGRGSGLKSHSGRVRHPSLAPRTGTQVGRERSAKPLCASSILARYSKFYARVDQLGRSHDFERVGSMGSNPIPCTMRKWAKWQRRSVQIAVNVDSNSTLRTTICAPVVQRQETTRLGRVQCQFKSDPEYHPRLAQLGRRRLPQKEYSASSNLAAGTTEKCRNGKRAALLMRWSRKSHVGSAPTFSAMFVQ